MSSLRQNTDKNGFNIYQDMNFFPNQALSETNPRNGFQILNQSVDKTMTPWRVQEVDTGGIKKPCPDNIGLEKDQINEEESVKNSSGKKGHTKLCSRGHWRQAEDAKLKELVAQFGPQNWNLIAENLQGRSGKSCRLRWFNQLDPRINRRAFSEEEEETLLAAHKYYGNKWAMIARLFPGRTDNAVKNHWHVIMARKQREQSCMYKRRRPNSSSLHISPKKFDDTDQFQSDSATDHESASTCTDLSLSPSSAFVATPRVFSRFSPNHPRIGLNAEKEEIKESEGNGDGEDGRMRVELSSQTDSNSETSGSDASIGSNNNNNRTTIVADDKISLTFIDFLGVGAS